MKHLILFVLCLFFYDSKGDYSYNKNEPFNLETFGDFGEFIKKADFYENINTDSAYLYLHFAEEAIDSNSDLQNILFYFQKCKINYTYSRVDKSTKEIAVKGLELAEKGEYLYYELVFHKLLAEFSYPNNEKVFFHLLEALQIAERIGKNERIVGVLINITIILIENNKENEAKEYLNEIYNYIQDIPVDYQIRYYKLASNLESDLQGALSYLDTAINIANTYQLHVFEFKLYVEKALLYKEHNKIKEAIDIFEESDSILSINGLDHLSYDYYYIRSRFYYLIDEPQKAKMFFEKYLELSKNIKAQRLVTLLGAKIYALAKDSATAYKYHLKYVEEVVKEKKSLEDSLYVEFQHKHKVDLIKKDNKLKAEELKYYTLKVRAITVFSILIIMIIVYLYFLKIKKNKNRLKVTKKELNKELDISKYRVKLIEDLTHEIKTPLMIQKEIFTFFKDQISEEKYIHLIDIGYKNSEQLAYDIEQILYAMTIEPYTRLLQLTQINLGVFFQEIVEHYKIYAFSKGVSIRYMHNLSNDTIAELDSGKWATIFKNFFTNAVKFSSENCEIIVQIKVDKENLELSIKNYGSVIYNNEKDKVFDRFYQSDNKNTKDNAGHGIGLSIVKELADIMNAQVGFKSNYIEKSTTFYCRQQIKATTFLNRTHSIHFNNPEDIDLKLIDNKNVNRKQNILVVDNNELMIRFYEQLFSEYFNCDFAATGLEAIEMIKNNEYACVVTDVSMPKITGFELFQTVQKIKSDQNIPPFIFVTADNSVQTRKDAFSLGVYDFIVKPFVSKELIVRVNNVVRNHFNKMQFIKNNNEQFKNNSEITFNDDKRLLERIIKIIDKNLNNLDFTIQDLADSVFYSKRQLSRKTIQFTGLTPSKLILERRLLKAEYILKNSNNIRISEVQKMVGLKSAPYFNKVFKERFGVTPSDVRR